MPPDGYEHPGTGFSVDHVEHLPRTPKAFTVSFTSLEWRKAPDRQQGYSFPVPLPLLLAPQAREKLCNDSMTTVDGSRMSSPRSGARDVSRARVAWRRAGRARQWLGPELQDDR
jgi:hypothetical protein